MFIDFNEQRINISQIVRYNKYMLISDDSRLYTLEEIELKTHEIAERYSRDIESRKNEIDYFWNKIIYIKDKNRFIYKTNIKKAEITIYMSNGEIFKEEYNEKTIDNYKKNIKKIEGDDK